MIKYEVVPVGRLRERSKIESYDTRNHFVLLPSVINLQAAKSKEVIKFSSFHRIYIYDLEPKVRS